MLLSQLVLRPGAISFRNPCKRVNMRHGIINAIFAVAVTAQETLSLVRLLPIPQALLQVFAALWPTIVIVVPRI
jgi:hypothetical protein